VTPLMLFSTIAASAQDGQRQDRTITNLSTSPWQLALWGHSEVQQSQYHGTSRFFSLERRLLTSARVENGWMLASSAQWWWANGVPKGALRQPRSRACQHAIRWPHEDL